jgi:hypothetical protein
VSFLIFILSCARSAGNARAPVDPDVGKYLASPGSHLMRGQLRVADGHALVVGVVVQLSSLPKSARGEVEAQGVVPDSRSQFDR